MTATSVRHDNEDVRSVAGTDRSSIVRVEIQSNADLYTMTPPAYTMSVADGEETIDAEEYRPEKSERPNTLQSHPSIPNLQRARTAQSSASRAAGSSATQEAEAGPSNSHHIPPPSDLPPDYFTELTNNAAASSSRKCSILEERPATWLVKRKSLALCPLVATVLVKEGLVRSKDLELVSRSSGVKRDPTDPFSAVAFGVYDTVGDMLLGLVEGPVELGRQVAPITQKWQAKQDAEKKEQQKDNCSIVQEGPEGEAQIHLRPDSAQGFEQTKCYSDAESSKSKSALSVAPRAAGRVAVGTGKGLGRIVGAGLKAPMTFTHGLTRGFHNVPKMYGEEVREYENVVGIRSGLLVSGKGLAYGIGDGLKDFFVKPVEGAQKEGIIGFGKGVGKGIGNLVCKPAAGAIGIIGYSSVGVYKEIQGINFGRKDAAVEVVTKLGEAEYEQASDDVRLNVVKKWCQVMMKQK